jgi:hypothetical protein
MGRCLGAGADRAGAQTPTSGAQRWIQFCVVSLLQGQHAVLASYIGAFKSAFLDVTEARSGTDPG